jgi:hypothetical protein
MTNVLGHVIQENPIFGCQYSGMLHVNCLLYIGEHFIVCLLTDISTLLHASPSTMDFITSLFCNSNLTSSVISHVINWALHFFQPPYIYVWCKNVCYSHQMLHMFCKIILFNIHHVQCVVCISYYEKHIINNRTQFVYFAFGIKWWDLTYSMLHALYI